MPDLVTKSDIKAYAGIEHTDSDSRIGDIASHLESWIQGMTGRSFVEEQRTEELNGGGRFLFPHNPPISSISEIVDGYSGSTVDSSLYRVTADNRKIGRESRRQMWSDGRYRFDVTYTGGYGTTNDDMPDDLVEDLARLGTLIYNEPDLSITSLSRGDESASRGDIDEQFMKVVRKWQVSSAI